MFLYSFSFEKIISFRALIIQVNGTNRYRNEYHHHHHCYGYSQRKKKDDNYITGYTHNWRLVTKKKKNKTTTITKRDAKILLEKTVAVSCNVLLFVVL